MTGTSLYLAEGIPQGITSYGIPTWLAASGQGAAVVGLAATASSLPWVFKFAAGLVIDRYTWPAMGLRRPWLIGAQAIVALILLLVGLWAPLASSTMLIIAVSFLISSITAMQGTALGGLVVDLTPDDEQGWLNGFMLAGKVFGIAIGTAVSSRLLEQYGIRIAMFVLVGVFAMPASIAVFIRERAGEKLLPWTEGQGIHRGALRTADGWRGVLRLSATGLLRLDALLVVSLLFLYGIGRTLSDQGSALLAVRDLEWSESAYGNLVAYVSMAQALILLGLGGPAVDRLGPRTMALLGGAGSAVAALSLVAIGPVVQVGIVFAIWYSAIQLAKGLFYLTFLVLAMRVSEKRVASTSFSLITAFQSLGASAGGVLLKQCDRHGGHATIFEAAGLLFLAAGLLPLFASAAVSAVPRTSRRTMPARASREHELRSEPYR